MSPAALKADPGYVDAGTRQNPGARCLRTENVRKVTY